MQKVSGNKKTRVLTHKQKCITNSSLQAPLEQTLHLLPQKDCVPLTLAHRPQSFEAANATGDRDAAWTMDRYQRGAVWLREKSAVKSAPKGGGSEQRAGQRGPRDAAHCVPLPRIRSPLDLCSINNSAKWCKVLWYTQKYVKEPPPLFPTLLSRGGRGGGRKLHLVKWSGGISTGRGFLKNFFFFFLSS